MVPRNGMAAVKVCIVQMVQMVPAEWLLLRFVSSKWSRGMVAVKVCIVQMVPRNGSC